MKHAGTEVIETERCILRPFTLEDAPDMYSGWASDPEVVKYLTWPAHNDVSITEGILSSWIAEYMKADFYNWAVVLKDTGRAVGNISVVRINEATEALSIGYCLSRKLWGKGLMTECLSAVIGYLFENTSANRIDSTHDVDNIGSGRVMQKAGMTREGLLRAWAWDNQGLRDSVMYSMLRSEWAKN